MGFLAYVHVNQIQERNEFGQMARGTLSLQDRLMIERHASPLVRDAYLADLVSGAATPSFAMNRAARV